MLDHAYLAYDTVTAIWFWDEIVTGFYAAKHAMAETLRRAVLSTTQPHRLSPVCAAGVAQTPNKQQVRSTQRRPVLADGNADRHSHRVFQPKVQLLLLLRCQKPWHTSRLETMK
jgi:hypothetical protein